MTTEIEIVTWAWEVECVCGNMEHINKGEFPYDCPKCDRTLHEESGLKLIRRLDLMQLLKEEIEKLGVAKSEGLRILKSKLSGEE